MTTKTKGSHATIPMNRLPLNQSEVFKVRGERVKWPTIRGAYLTDESCVELRNHVTKRGRSIIFLDGEYLTNLNKFAGRPPEERAVFFEYLIKHPRVKGGIFLLCWIGNFHNGSIYHCGWQFPQVKCWEDFGTGAEAMFERKAFKVYKEVVEILYKHSPNEMDSEVQEFIASS